MVGIEFFYEYESLESQLKKIERMDKTGLSLDEQERLLNKYTNLWERIAELNKQNKPW